VQDVDRPCRLVRDRDVGDAVSAEVADRDQARHAGDREGSRDEPARTVVAEDHHVARARVGDGEVGPAVRVEVVAHEVGGLAAVEGRLAAIPQDAARATSAPPIEREQLWLDWKRSNVELLNQVRAFAPAPCAVTRIGAGGRRLKLLEARLGTSPSEGAPGQVLTTAPGQLEVVCGKGTLELCRAQVEGGKPQSSRELLSGRLLQPGQQLGGEGTAA